MGPGCTSALVNGHFRHNDKLQVVLSSCYREDSSLAVGYCVHRAAAALVRTNSPFLCFVRGLTIRSSGPLRRVRGNLTLRVAAATYLKR